MSVYCRRVCGRPYLANLNAQVGERFLQLLAVLGSLCCLQLHTRFDQLTSRFTYQNLNV